MTTCSVGELAPEARAALDEYLAGVAASLDDDLRDLVVCDLRSWLLDHLTPRSTAGDVWALAAEAGPISDEEPPVDKPGRLRGTFWGIPYDLSWPTGRKIADRLWDPADPTIWRPRVFGAGWTPNLGALAVRLGLIEPDAEDEPFSSTPATAFVAAAAIPVGLAAATALHYAVRGGSLPAELPNHWALDGTPDRFVTKRVAAASDLAATVVPAAAGLWAVASGRPRPARAGVLAAASGMAAIGALVTVARSLPPRPRWWIGPGLALGSVGASAMTVLGLARAGRRAEQRRDLGGW